MKVLIIDDKATERDKGARAAKALGWEVVVCDPTSLPGREWFELIDGVDGVITDLMWPYHDHGDKPGGLLVVIHAIFLGKPVVICTNGKHHGESMAFIHDGYMMAVARVHTRNHKFHSKKPFGWNDHKNWPAAMKQLAAFAVPKAL